MAPAAVIAHRHGYATVSPVPPGYGLTRFAAAIFFGWVVGGLRGRWVVAARVGRDPWGDRRSAWSA
jgi:hypothetical protein